MDPIALLPGSRSFEVVKNLKPCNTVFPAIIDSIGLKLCVLLILTRVRGVNIEWMIIMIPINVDRNSWLLGSEWGIFFEKPSMPFPDFPQAINYCELPILSR